MAVERHVADGGNAARRGRGRAGEEALPVGAAGLVEVHVRVDQPGQDVQPARVDHRVGHARRVRGQDGLDTSVLQQQVSLADRQLVDELSTVNQRGAHVPRTRSSAASARSAVSGRASAPSRPSRQVRGATWLTCTPNPRSKCSRACGSSICWWEMHDGVRQHSVTREAERLQTLAQLRADVGVSPPDALRVPRRAAAAAPRAARTPGWSARCGGSAARGSSTPGAGPGRGSWWSAAWPVRWRASSARGEYVTSDMPAGAPMRVVNAGARTRRCPSRRRSARGRRARTWRRPLAARRDGDTRRPAL